MQKIALVIPCFNEAERLDEKAFSLALDQMENLDYIFVNDGSSDKTGEMLDSYQKRHSDRVLVLHLPENKGKAEAVRMGVQNAFERKYQLTGFWDADLATPLYHVKDFSLRLEEDDVTMVIGSRVRLLGRSIERKAVRHYLGRVFATVVSWALRTSVYDTQCGAKLFKTRPVMEFAFGEPFTTAWIFDVEVLARMIVFTKNDGGDISLASAIVEYPLEEWAEIAGSKVRAVHFVRAALDFLKIYFRYRNRF